MQLIFNWIIDFFTQSDKIKHIFLSAIILVFDFCVRYFFISKGRTSRSAVYAIRDTLMIGIGKEIADALGFWTPDALDILGDVLWFLFPIYLYFLYKEAFLLKKKKLFKYGDDVIRANILYIQNVIKETYEGIVAWLKYIFLLSEKLLQQGASNRKDIILSSRKKNKELYEAKISLKKWGHVLIFTIRFFFWGILDFLIDILIMPFYIVWKTVSFFYKSIRIFLSPLKKCFLSMTSVFNKKER